ncbi:hypothetical protein BASA81_003268 [Batrachochytrium salamandrivorans]|nr:hypothetical protein BASA81_003268 [Batrachochytrium salamandrivorans]
MISDFCAWIIHRVLQLAFAVMFGSRARLLLSKSISSPAPAEANASVALPVATPATAVATERTLQLSQTHKQILLQARVQLHDTQTRLHHVRTTKQRGQHQHLEPGRLEAAEDGGGGEEEVLLLGEISALQEILHNTSWQPLQRKLLADEEDGGRIECKICFDKQVAIVLLPCGHVLCKPCGRKVTPACCFCKRRILTTNPIYL